MVFIGHFLGDRGHSAGYSMLLSLAYSGVQIFFVISGYLITTLLLREKERYGRIDLRAFYWRRTLRIFPAAYTLIAVLAVVGAIGKWYVAASATYLMSYFTLNSPWVIGHLWSLSVEEQFYWVWPVVLVLAFRHGKAVAWAVMLISPLVRLLFYHQLGWFDTNHYFPTVADSIAAGCLLALYYPQLKRRATWLAHPVIVAGGGVFALLLRPLLSVTTNPRMILGGTVPLLMAACIFGAIEGNFALLNNRVTAWFGMMSYSLYLWQQPFARGTHLWNRLPWSLACTFLAALVSCYLIEKPFLSLRTRFQHAEPKPVATGV